MSLPKDRNALKREFHSWLNGNQREHEAPISEAIDVLYDVSTGGTKVVGEHELATLRRGLELPYMVSYPLAEHVCELALTHQVLSDLLLELATHRLAKVRRNAMTICLHDRPEETVVAMLVAGLQDKSKAVRLKAADVILRTQKRAFAREVRQCAQRESDPEASRVLGWTADLLERNWSRGEDGHITVYLPDGGVSGFIAEAEASDDHIAQRAAAMRSVHER